MSLAKDIINKDSPIIARQLFHLIKLIKLMGWESFLDDREICPNFRRAIVYLKKYSIELSELFKDEFKNINKNNLLEILNPILIEMWHVNIIKSDNGYNLQLLIKQN